MEQSSGFENSGFASKRKRTLKSTSLRNSAKEMAQTTEGDWKKYRRQSK
jgi:hypothetical protein